MQVDTSKSHKAGHVVFTIGTRPCMFFKRRVTKHSTCTIIIVQCLVTLLQTKTYQRSCAYGVPYALQMYGNTLRCITYSNQKHPYPKNCEILRCTSVRVVLALEVHYHCLHSLLRHSLCGESGRNFPGMIPILASQPS